jgi:hypothetical protein
MLPTLLRYTPEKVDLITSLRYNVISRRLLALLFDEADLTTLTVASFINRHNQSLL